MLDQIKVASPCSADWEQMEGTNRVRFCGECKKNVFNLSAMTRRDAEALIKETNGNLCARLHRRADGTVLTEDCPAGLRVKIARIQRRVRWAVAGALSFATAWGQEARPSLSGVVEGILPGVKISGVPKSRVVAFYGKSTKSMVSVTNEKGEFRFQNVEPGTYVVVTSASGFADSVLGEVVVGQGEKKVQTLLQIGRNDLGSVGQD